MRAKILPLKFFQRPTLEVAPELLGKYLVRDVPRGRRLYGVITEVEAYDGLDDMASHACRTPKWPNGRRTLRTEVLFAAGGVWYVQLIYGMYWMLNIITGEKDYPAGVLIRGVEGVNGPGRLAKHFGIDKRFNNQPATKTTGLYIEDRGIIKHSVSIKTAPRIGVAYAGPIWSKKKWRFVLNQQS